MIANRRNLSEILEQTIRLVAPLFQRPYVWNQDRNWEPLWLAIEGAANRRHTGADKIQPHFLGAVVLDQQNVATGQVPAREIIDGQQRLTTLQIAMAAARDLLTEWNSEFYSQRLRALTANHTKLDDQERYKVWPTNRDREEFRAMMKIGAGEEKLLPHGQSRLADAYRFFRESTIKWFEQGTEEQRDDLAEALTTAFTQDLLLVVIDLDQDDDGQLIFETLNALGTPLLPSDLVKNLLFHESEKAGLNSERLYEQFWSEFDQNDKYWREELRVGRLKRPRLDVFLQHYLTLKWGKFIMVEGSFRAYRDLILEEKFNSVEEAFCDFRQFADLYKSFDNSVPGSVEERFFKRFWILDTQAVVPILLELFYRHPLAADRKPFLEDIESYFFRRMICQLTAQSTNLMVIELLVHQERNGWTHQAMREYFISRAGDRTRWPSDEDLKRAVVTRPIYARVQQWRVVQLLKFYEDSLHNEMTDPVTYNGELTLEHVMPRSWESNWPLIAEDPIEAKAQRIQKIDTLGNLTLVTGKLNTSLSNSAWDKKRDTLRKHAILRMNHEVIEHETWSDESILARGEKLYEVFRTLWPRPSDPIPVESEIGVS